MAAVTPNALPVLIVGAGPTGLACAMSLARAHTNVRLVDRAPRPSPHSRAIGIQARTLELFEQHRVVEPFSRSVTACAPPTCIRTVIGSRASISTHCKRVIPICSVSINRSRSGC